MSMKQDNQALAMSIALKSQTSESSKKKPFYKALFKSKKAKVRSYLCFTSCFFYKLLLYLIKFTGDFSSYPCVGCE